jgi:acylphosphatase
MVITGRVQGVFFRYNTKKRADLLSLKGYAKNLEDGNVEVVAEGPEHKLQDLLDWCKQGPEQAQVDYVHELWQSTRDEFENFLIA